MPIVDSVVVVGVTDNSKAYEALSALKSLSEQQQLTARSAAVVERDQSGTLQIKDSFDGDTGTATAGGGFVGMLLGVIGGSRGHAFGLHRQAPSPAGRSSCAAPTTKTRS